MEPIKCFLLEPAPFERHSVRRYSECRCEAHSYHTASNTLVDLPTNDSASRQIKFADRDRYAALDKWPSKCSCGYEFTEIDKCMVDKWKLYERKDTGERMTLHEAPLGAMWFADWYNDIPGYLGPDGRSLIVRIPDKPDLSGYYDWMVDGRCSNCGSPQDMVHKCWVRHGEAPDIHVDKAGHTCSAGAGSIVALGGWHGFLDHGFLTEQRK